MLRELDLSHNKIGDMGAKGLAKGLCRNTSVKTLRLVGNDIHDAGAMALGYVLKNNNHLELIDVSDNYIQSRGIVALSEGMCQNTCITSLQLSWNSVGVSGAEASLCAMLRATEYLKNLDVKGCDIESHEIFALSNASQSNESFEEIDLSVNGFPFWKGTAAALATMLRSNRCLRRLRLSMSQLQDYDWWIQEVVSDRLAHNHTEEISTLFPKDALLKSELDYYLSLNRYGRKLLRQPQEDIPTGLWVHVLGGVTENPNLLYYFLKAKPKIDRTRKREEATTGRAKAPSTGIVVAYD